MAYAARIPKSAWVTVTQCVSKGLNKFDVKIELWLVNSTKLGLLIYSNYVTFRCRDGQIYKKVYLDS